jgi:hypothetical protein
MLQMILVAAALPWRFEATTAAIKFPLRSERFDRSYGSHDFRSQEKHQKISSGGRQDRRRTRFGSGRGRPHCSHCGEMGHWVQTCYELHGYPVGHPKAKSIQAQNVSTTIA